ncbi:MAG: hypothetical protein RI900_2101 [Actinomycetota bacterium]|jgi:hypothetical protein
MTTFTTTHQRPRTVGTRRASNRRHTGLVQWAPTQRRLVLVDIENIVGGSHSTEADVERALQRLRRAIGIRTDDVWITACGPTLLTTAMGLFHSRVLLGRGLDGADRQLVEYLRPDQVVHRYAAVALASADGRAFAEPVARLAAAGVPTDIYVGSGQPGHALARAARSITAIHSLDHVAA